MKMGKEISSEMSDEERQKYYEELGLPFDIIHTGIEELQISGTLKKVLFKLGVWDLFDLLIIDYETIANEKNLGEKNIKELKDYIHGLGLTFKYEREFLSEILEKKRREGVRLLEDYGLSSRVYLTLYHNGIYSFNDVLRYGPEINNLKSFGPLRQKELAAKMAELGISFAIEEESIDKKVASLPYDSEHNEEIIAELAVKDQHLAELHEKHKKLIDQYNALEDEKKRLTARLGEIEYERAQVVTSFLER